MSWQVDGLRVPSTPLTNGRALWKRTLDELPRSEIVGEINRLVRRQSPESTIVSDHVIEAHLLNKLECFLCQRDAAAFSCVVYGLVSIA